MKDTEVEPRRAIGARIREARKFAGLSQGQVAKLMNMHRPTISEIEGGNRRVSHDELRQFAKLYDVSMDFLTGDAPETLAIDDPKLQLAARELQKLKPEQIEQLLRVLAALRNDDPQS
jgi:transcriptional regulator with XRE-family HTH domain